ncbi:SUMO-specific isopeptidase USPL1 [Tiliqua scincoides]|uniref:SUMO-specific isopeptidase USPL1 n=1 Tax=Tiliqua scincoides TaxID=71010 RepID=UPI0034627FB6
MMDYQKTGNSLQVAGIGASALHMVGYLGKDSNSVEVTPDECCPACKKKGLKQALRIYRINFEESIFLCENPQCIYPLGFEPLSNIIIPIDSKDYPSRDTCRKRKLFDTSLVASPIVSCLKLTKANTLMDTEQTLNTDFVSELNEDHQYETQSKQLDGSSIKRPNFNNTAESMEQKMGLEMAVQESSLATFTMQTQLLPDSSVSENQHQDNKSLPEPLCLQWKNMYALCWLDCILSALVHLETLKMNLSGSVSEKLPIIQRLLAEYNQASELVHTCQRGKHVSGIPLDVLSRAESHLNEIRNIIFLQLQPQLKCKLGQKESPVFAFPLLLKKDPQIENLFLLSFSWKFECLQCGHQVSDRCKKSLTTFTNIIPEWHPLNAVHIAPCNKCNHTSQRRKMVLEKVPSILMIHFVEGLAHSDLAVYSFKFQEDFYQITSVVQYQEAAKHFITWILNSDGTWLECDDLKGSYCIRHKNFEVPPSEVHIVIWERKTSQVTNDLTLHLQSKGTMNVPLMKAQSDSPVKCVDDKAVDNTPLVCHEVDMENAHTNKTQNVISNNKSNSLLGFENLADDDIITLTLVNVPLDLGGKPLEDSSVIENLPVAETGTLRQQGPGAVDTSPATSKKGIAGNECMLLENTSTPLQPKNASTPFIMPAVPLSNSSCLPETLPVQGAEVKGNLIPVKNSSSFEPESPQIKISRQIPGSSVQETLNIVAPAKKIPADSQVSAPTASNNSSLTCHMNGTKPRVGSWVKGLLGKYPSFMPKSALTSNKTESSTQPLKRETASNSLIKGASHFHGFQAKCSNQNKKVANRALDYSQKKLPPTSPAASLGANLSVERHAICRNEGIVTKSAGLLATLDKQIQSSQSHSENKNFTWVNNVQDSRADQAHQLRLKLQELNAKKKKLDKLAVTQKRNRSSLKKSVKGHSQLGSQKENESLQSLLKELQHQIDVESVNSPSTNMSQCSSSSYDDILSELLSPATTVASSEISQEEECRYLEMGSGSPKSLVHSGKFVDAQATNHDHSYHSPVKRNVYEDDTDLLINKSPPNRSIESPPKQDILEDLLPNSTMADIEDLHYFDESLLSW